MKKTFAEPTIEVELFAVEDVIATSPEPTNPHETPDW